MSEPVPAINMQSTLNLNYSKKKKSSQFNSIRQPNNKAPDLQKMRARV